MEIIAHRLNFYEARQFRRKIHRLAVQTTGTTLAVFAALAVVGALRKL